MTLYDKFHSKFNSATTEEICHDDSIKDSLESSLEIEHIPQNNSEPIDKPTPEPLPDPLKEELKGLCSLTIDVHRNLLQIIAKEALRIQNPFLTKEEKPNPFYQAVLNNSVKLLLTSLKLQDEEEDEAIDRSLLIEGMDFEHL